MKCFIEPLAALKMKYYVASVDAEISGVGKTHMIGKDIYVDDVIIFKQKCTGSHTDLDIEDEMKVMHERDLRNESSKDWNLWWHSHNSMAVFWSGTDTKNIEDQAGNGSYYLSIVTNNNGDFKTRFDIFPKDTSPFKVITSCMVEDDIETTILGNNNNPEREAELLTAINEMELMKETNETAVNTEYETKTKEIEEQIQAWNDCLTDAETEQADKIKLFNDSLDEQNQEIIDEYTSLASQELLDDKELEEIIKSEVLTKVTTPTATNGLSKFLNFGKKSNKPYKMSGGYDYGDDDDYDSYMYGIETAWKGNKKQLPLIEDIPTEDDDDIFYYKIQDIKTSQFLDEDNYPQRSQPLHTDDTPEYEENVLINETIYSKDGKEIGFKII